MRSSSGCNYRVRMEWRKMIGNAVAGLVVLGLVVFAVRFW